MNYTLKSESGHFNFSPVGFRLAAEDFLRSAIASRSATFSIVPFFMCCRAIELALKAVHLENISQAEVKFRFSHELRKSYDALPLACRALDKVELKLLTAASSCYAQKAFEYVQPVDAATAYTRFPDLDALVALSNKIVALAATRPR